MNYEIYWAYDEDDICRYVGIGKTNRHRHVNSGKSHNDRLNHYVNGGKVFRVVVEERDCYETLILEEKENINKFGREINNTGVLWNKAINGNGNPGEQNGMFGKKHTDESKKQMSENSPSYKGALNPNYGKKHTTDSIQKMKDNRRSYKGGDNPRAKKVLADGVIYDTMADVMRAKNTSRHTVRKKIKEGIWKYYES